VSHSAARSLSLAPRREFSDRFEAVGWRVGMTGVGRLVTDEPRPKSEIREDCGEMMKHAARRPPDFALACRSRHVHTLRLAHLGNAVEATRLTAWG